MARRELFLLYTNFVREWRVRMDSWESSKGPWECNPGLSFFSQSFSSPTNCVQDSPASSRTTPSTYSSESNDSCPTWNDGIKSLACCPDVLK